MARFQCATCDRVETINLFTPEACSSCGGSMVLIKEPEETPRFDFLSTPNEAWLVVPKDAFCAMGMSIASLNDASRLSPGGALALAEDPDAIRFMDLWQAANGPVALNENPYSVAVIAEWQSARDTDCPNGTAMSLFQPQPIRYQTPNMGDESVL